MPVEEEFEESWPRILPARGGSTNVGKWADAHQIELDDVDADIDELVDSHQILNAPGDELDRLGDFFGTLGNRRGRSNPEYRQALLALYLAAVSTGRAKDVRAAIAAATLVEKKAIAVPEDTTELEYDIIIGDWKREHRLSQIAEAADIADASVVTLGSVEHELRDSDIQKSRLSAWSLSSGKVHLSEGDDETDDVDGSLPQRVDELVFGDGTDETADGMQNVLHTANTATSAATETRLGADRYEIAATVTGGQEIPAGATLTEFGAVASGEDRDLVKRQVRDAVEVDAGDTTTIIQTIEYLDA
jgi:hypothetical protein